jgi:glycine cleavage system regulatory protein
MKELDMKSTFIMSVVGPDSPSAIKAIAETTRGLGGEWLQSKVMRLDGNLTAMMKVVVDLENETRLKSELEKDFSGLQFFYSDVVSGSDLPTRSINVVLDCKDRPGLTKDINAILANLGLIVENMECNRAHVSTIGEAVFTARIALAVPEDMTSESVADEIEAMAKGIRVNVI